MEKHLRDVAQDHERRLKVLEKEVEALVQNAKAVKKPKMEDDPQAFHQ